MDGGLLNFDDIIFLSEYALEGVRFMYTMWNVGWKNPSAALKGLLQGSSWSAEDAAVALPW